jgi:hypothetical protein
VSQYLMEAAALLRKAAEENEKANDPDQAFGSGCSERHLLIEGRERIAMKFAQLGAIERGVVPPEMVGDLLGLIVRSEGRS